jgi:hydroxyethylthiazole kinase-like uncharacterized protein yjeF
MRYDRTMTAHPITQPRLKGPDADSHKYGRGKVAVIGGALPGAALLAACAAQRAGAGYVELLGAVDAGPPFALVRRPWSAEALADPRIGAVVVGPGLGDHPERLAAAIASGHPLILDADALQPGLDLTGREAILTPHAGEYARMFGDLDLGTAAKRAGAVILLKGSRTRIAAPDGRLAIADPASPWLASAGTGDVLSGILAAMVAQRALHGFDLLAAAKAAVWLHAEAARLAGPALIADDLVAHLPRSVSACL